MLEKVIENWTSRLDYIRASRGSPMPEILFKISRRSFKSAALEETLTNSSDIIISGDGTWKTRGYSSRVGVCAVIGDKTGKCIDAEVMSSFCKGCDSWKRRKGSPAYKKFLHVKSSSECLKNHNGSAGMMETVGMVRIFQRSLSHRSVRYASYIGDGDSKTFSSITASNPYGEDITVSKIECVGQWELVYKIKTNELQTQ
ncbi:uncharacterized protein TNCV_1959881 [Trichonephila clavipes]|nr:uncharacterized protein TNCV_1959881 [Trichonephila clavipes]